MRSAFKNKWKCGLRGKENGRDGKFESRQLSFFPAFAAVLADEAGDFLISSPIQRRCASVSRRIHIRPIGDQQFGDFLGCHKMQRRLRRIILRIHIHAVGDEKFDDVLVTAVGRTMDRSSHRVDIRASSQVLLDGFDISCFGGLGD